MLDQKLNKLIDLTISKSIDKIKKLLEESDMSLKGALFEKYLVELFKGNGWLAVRNGRKNDEGADILLYHPQQPEKVFVIIQAKNYNKPLTFDETKIELMKFEEKSRVSYKCNNYMLVSLNGFVKNAKKLEEFNMKLEEWNYVVNELIYNYSQIPPKEPNIELFAHNKIAYENSIKALKRSNKIAFIQATGTGKSYIIIKYLANFTNKKSIILAPSTYILEQLMKKAFWATGSTDFMTYAKLKNFNEEEIRSLKYDLIVLDEFHRCGAEFWGKGVKRLLDNNKRSIIIGTSATPVRYSDNERDMSEELFENNIAVNLSLAEAIVKRILPMPIYISSLYTLDEEIYSLSTKISNSNINDNDKTTFSNKLLSIKKDWDSSKGIPYILKKYIKNSQNKFIVFCENKEHLYEMEWLVEKWFKQTNLSKNIKKYRVISGEGDSEKELNDFTKANDNSKIYLLFAIDMLNEGLHINDVSGVILLRNTKSPRIFYQQIGRAVQSGNIENPIIFDFVNNFNNICTGDFIDDLEEAKLREVSKRASLGLEDNCPSFTIIDESKETEELFKELEDRLIDSWEYWYNKLAEYNRIHNNCIVPKDEIDLWKWCSRQRLNYSAGKIPEDKVTKLNSINFIWSLKDYHWFQMYEKLKEYKTRYNDCKVSRNYLANPQLGFWVGTQRKKMHMTQERFNALNAIGFDWGDDERWFLAYQGLKEFKETYGHFDIPRDYKAGGVFLFHWIQKQRLKYNGDSKRKPLTQEQIRLLNEINFHFNRDEKWENMLQKFIDYKDTTGKTSVSRKINSKLAHWIANQRKYYRQGKLSNYKLEKLHSNGFEFDYQ